jgi:MFS superfamily sulfate permease-like transporter
VLEANFDEALLGFASYFNLRRYTVGLIETLLTQQLVDDITERRTATHVECIAQGLGNVANGILGGMGWGAAASKA